MIRHVSYLAFFCVPVSSGCSTARARLESWQDQKDEGDLVVEQRPGSPSWSPSPLKEHEREDTSSSPLFVSESVTMNSLRD
jgi:hypothetical protein